MPIKYTVHVPQQKLDEIHQRISRYCWSALSEAQHDGWHSGINMAWLKQLCDYWLNDYDWRACEAQLNRYPQFIETIDGEDIHFVHVVGEADGKRPIILTHGWPGSHYEFWGVIDKLAFPSKSGGSSADAFDVVVPSLPGFGFSATSRRPPGPRATGALWNTLMTQTLGYKHYVAQGGDLGSLVTTFLGLGHGACVGVHLNMVATQLGDPQPHTAEEGQWLKNFHAVMQAEGAYLQLHTTKPQTISAALMDSPVGTAAWILEKMHAWSDLRKGSLDTVYSKDQLLTNIMIYLVNDAIASSIWFYRALVLEGEVGVIAQPRVDKPTGIANFLGEPVYQNPPRSWVERMYNIIHWSDIDEGGHFAAMETPDHFVTDIRAFAQTMAY